eukprot:TRINITY_DN2269_c0_g1_i3.p3 TRINITY_DN2269_c0_g1~~TRINITY_DN2269_c0_g1_i3.p3  ORF type:complete len:132 (-),score=12.50 TRINITY_DN2269_c0_g1_i3:379-774(-)
MFMAHEKIEVLDENTEIVWERVRGQFIVSSRDYTVLCHTVNLPNGTIICGATSIDETKRKPVPSGVVRADVQLAAWIFIPQPEFGGTKVIYMFQVDPMGMIPKMVVNWVSRSQCDIINKLRDYVVNNNLGN